MSRRAVAHALLIVAALALPPAAGCFVSSLDLVEATATGGSGGASTGGGGAGVGGSAGAGGGACEHVSWPPAPGSSDPGADVVDLVVAAYELNLGETDLSVGPQVGYDLDSRCTCAGDGSSCKEPSWATGDHCDGPAGRDNATAQLFGIMGNLDPSFTSAKYSDDAEAGKSTLLIRVRDYNGQPNDTQVTVSLHPSPGLDKDPCNGPSPTPAWDGSDRWPVAASSLTGGPGGGGGGGGDPCSTQGYDIDNARYIDTGAYVTDGVVVANLPEAALVFASDNAAVAIKLTAGAITGKLEQQADGWHLTNGLLVGRWRLDDIFRLLGSVALQGQAICTDNPAYPLIKSAVCKYPDVASQIGGPTTPCDALSFGLQLTAKPVVIGAVFKGIAATPLCPAPTDPTHDTCG